MVNAGGLVQPGLTVYSREEYAFGAKAPKRSDSASDSSKGSFLNRLQRAYAREGMRRSIAAVMLVQVCFVFFQNESTLLSKLIVALHIMKL